MTANSSFIASNNQLIFDIFCIIRKIILLDFLPAKFKIFKLGIKKLFKISVNYLEIQLLQLICYISLNFWEICQKVILQKFLIKIHEQDFCFDKFSKFFLAHPNFFTSIFNFSHEILIVFFYLHIFCA